MKSSAWLVIVIPVIVICFFVMSWFIEVSYNNSLVQMFNLQQITFSQACWLNTLSFLLFRNIPTGSSKK